MPRTLKGLIDALDRVRNEGDVSLDTPVVLRDDDFDGQGDYIALDSLLSDLGDDGTEYVFTYEVKVTRNVIVRAANQLDAYTRVEGIVNADIGIDPDSIELIEVTLNGRGVGEWPLS